MKIDILTLFPGMFENVLGESMLKIAQKKRKIKVNVHDLRKWTLNKHKTADDKPYGGGSGMVMKIEPIHRAIAHLVGEETLEKITEKKRIKKELKIILLTPGGKRLDQGGVKKLAKLKHIILICGHYEGIDGRVNSLISEEISIGDYVLTGGEIPALVIVDCVARLIPGVLGDKRSAKHESFENNLLEHPHYTRPREFKGMKVPSVLLSGDHKKIQKWRSLESLRKTKRVRKDLFKLITKKA